MNQRVTRSASSTTVTAVFPIGWRMSVGSTRYGWFWFRPGYQADFASVKELQEALGCAKFVEVDRIPMATNYGKGYMADLVIYRL